jgi:hypothetical protein
MGGWLAEAWRERGRVPNHPLTTKTVIRTINGSQTGYFIEDLIKGWTASYMPDVLAVRNLFP